MKASASARLGGQIRSALLLSLVVATVIFAVYAIVRPTSIDGDKYSQISAEAMASFENSTVVAPRAVFIGDSYTAGAGASVLSNRWSSVVANSQGWRETNFSIGGSGYLRTSSVAGCGVAFCPNFGGAIAKILKAEPDIVVVAGGRQDLDLPGADAAILSFFQDLRAGLPSARIIVVSPIWDDDAAPLGLSTLSDAVRAAALSIGAEYLDVKEPIFGHPDFVTSDGVQLNDRGHAALAAAVLKKLLPVQVATK